MYEHMHASLKLGTTRVGVNTLYAWPEMKHVLTDSATRVLMVDARVRKLIDERRAELMATSEQVLRDHIATRRHTPGEDYVTDLIEAEAPGDTPGAASAGPGDR